MPGTGEGFDWGHDQLTGVEIDNVVYGICRLQPRENRAVGPMRVHGVVGRFLEYSRASRFCGDDPVHDVVTVD